MEAPVCNLVCLYALFVNGLPAHLARQKMSRNNVCAKISADAVVSHFCIPCAHGCTPQLAHQSQWQVLDERVIDSKEEGGFEVKAFCMFLAASLCA